MYPISDTLEVRITLWDVLGASLHVITSLVPQLLLSMGICGLLEVKPREPPTPTLTCL